MIPTDNILLNKCISDIANVAGFLWDKDWAERNGGNISVNVTQCFKDENCDILAIERHKFSVNVSTPSLIGDIIYVSGSGCRMRDIAKAPLDNGVFIIMESDKGDYSIVDFNGIIPTSELPTHIMIHENLKERNIEYGTVLHTHPTELIAMSHSSKLMDEGVMNNILWEMIPEVKMFVPKGVGIARFQEPGSVELARETISLLDKHDVILWEKHGVIAAGNDIVELFDMIDTLSKGAKIYMYGCAMNIF